MKYLTLLTAIMVILSSCDNTNNKDAAIIKVELSNGQFKKLLGQHLYLYKLSTGSIIDSVFIKNKNIVFHLAIDSSFEPYMVWIKCNDSYKGNVYRRPLGFVDPYKARTIPCTFYIDRGVTSFKSYDRDDSTTDVKSFTGSKQNIVYFNNIELYYPSDSNRTAIIDRNIHIIKAYPYALDFLRVLFNYKEHFLDAELKQQLSYFDNDVKRTKLFKNFENYFKVSANFDKAYPVNISLQNSGGIYRKIGNDSATFNLIVFWASWCGPCRQEIPELKKLYAAYGSKGLSITSISLDNGKQNWQTAMRQEKMPWQQLIAIDSSFNTISLNYNISAIPKAYLFDKNKKLISKFEGSKSGLRSKIATLFKIQSAN